MTFKRNCNLRILSAAIFFFLCLSLFTDQCINKLTFLRGTKTKKELIEGRERLKDRKTERQKIERQKDRKTEIEKNRETERQRDKNTEIQRDRQKDRETERKTDRKTEIQ